MTSLPDHHAHSPAGQLARDHIRSLVVSLCAEDWGRSPAEIGGVLGPVGAMAVAALARVRKCPLAVLVPGPRTGEDLLMDLSAFEPDLPVIEIPEAEFSVSPESSTTAEWLPVLSKLGGLRSDASAVILCAGVQGLLSPLPEERKLIESRLELAVGMKLPPRQLADRLQAAGLEPSPQIELAGQFSMRGGVFDLWAPSEAQPLRIEYFGDDIESIRAFDPATQRSVATLRQAAFPLILPETGKGKSSAEDLLAGLLNYLPQGTLPVTLGRREILQRLDGMTPFLRGHGARSRHAAALEYLGSVPRVDLIDGPVMARRGVRMVETIPYAPRAGGTDAAAEAIRAMPSDTPVVGVWAGSEGEAKRLSEAMTTHGLAAVTVTPHEISGSVRLPLAGCALISGADLLGKHRLRAGLKPDEFSLSNVSHRAIEDFIRLDTGDYVVHADYGIARFKGVEELRKPDGSRGEFLHLEFDQHVVAHIPVTHADAVQKYIGSGGGKPRLSKYRGGQWQERKESVREAVLGLAAEMLRLQAKRLTQGGFACPPSDQTLHDFVESFPYRDTPDQEKGWAEIERDMEMPRPMDRLVCGDVGFGKTELAIRACMKVVCAGKQAAVLVPTTVLAQQHFKSFSDRCAGYAVKVDYLSRFKSDKEARQTIEALAKGRVDIVIGTHRMLSADVHVPNLGLLVVDEEQRFGVEHKDRLKALRESVDVLTLSATPIPRTLHMALLGIRDISSLTTPPEHRHPVETRVTKWDDRLIRESIAAELARDGQVYFVHNRVQDIHRVANWIRELAPEARVEVGHGQMPESQLEDVMRRFLDREVDVLVSTTIIESGIDVPTANTMFIDEAHRYGLADLHQLRGRVGRYRHQAHCHLIVPEEWKIREQAIKRLRAIVEHHMLGSGFHIAMRDLELRGAGNIIGKEQSGFISSVGYDLYCQLLEQAVRQLRGEATDHDAAARVELSLDLVLPRKWIEDASSRVEVYRKVGRVRNAAQADAVKAELTDRFGKPPRVLDTLLTLALVRARLGRLGVVSASVGRVANDLPPHFKLKCHHSAATCERLRKGSPGFRTQDSTTIVLPLPKSLEQPADQLRYLSNMLQVMVSRGHLAEESAGTGQATPQEGQKRE